MVHFSFSGSAPTAPISLPPDDSNCILVGGPAPIVGGAGGGGGASTCGDINGPAG